MAHNTTELPVLMNMNASVQDTNPLTPFAQSLSEDEHELLTPKLLAMVGSVAVSAVCSSIPYTLASLCSRCNVRLMDTRVMSVVNCVTAGFYLGLSFLYFLTNAREQAESYVVKANIEIPYPIVEGAVCFGFVIVSVVESVVQMGNEVFMFHVASISTVATSSWASRFRSTLMGGANDKSVSNSNPNVNENKNAEPGYRIPVTSPKRGALVLMVSLSIQTWFAGIAIGLQLRTADVFHFMTAVMFYVSVVSFDLGQKLFSLYRRRPLKALYMGLLFALVAPCGTSVGIAWSQLETQFDVTSMTLVSAILLAFAAGIFLHVSFISHLHVKIPRALHYNSLARVLFMIIGLLLVSVLKLLSSQAFDDFLQLLGAKSRD